MSAKKPAPRYNRFQRVLLLLRHYGRTRIGVPLGMFALLIVGVIGGLIAATLFSYLLACVLNHLFFGRFGFERIFCEVWLPCAIIAGGAGRAYFDSKTEEWEARLRDAMTKPPSARICETLPESEILVRASPAAASDSFLLTPASAPPDKAPHTLLRAAASSGEPPAPRAPSS